MNLLAKKLIVLDSVDSTNNYAMGMIQNGEAESGMAVFAMNQTHGKGRREKRWKAAPGLNILLSVIAQTPQQSVLQQFPVSAAAALGCFDLLAKYTQAPIKIKWPNDIYLDDRKAGGLLIENVISGTNWQWCVVGAGINVNQTDFEEHENHPISLSLVTGFQYDVIQMASQLQLSILNRLKQLEAGGMSGLIEEYNFHLFAKNLVVKLKKGSAVFKTMIRGVTAHGKLMTRDVMERQFAFDEVEFRGIVN